MNSNKDLIKNVIKKYCKAENVIVVMDFDHTIIILEKNIKKEKI